MTERQDYLGAHFLGKVENSHLLKEERQRVRTYKEEDMLRVYCKESVGAGEIK